jgi:hypothetical protein
MIRSLDGMVLDPLADRGACWCPQLVKASELVQFLDSFFDHAGEFLHLLG